MKAMEFKVDGPMGWAKVPEVTAAAGEVIVEIAATAVNRADVHAARGHYPPPPGESEIIGLECSGVIVRWARASRAGRSAMQCARSSLVAATRAGGGAATQLLPVPAGSGGGGGGAARGGLHRVGGMRELPARARRSALVHGGSGGIGTMAMQMLRSRGFRVAVTASARHSRLVQMLGAEIAIDYRSRTSSRSSSPRPRATARRSSSTSIGADYLERNLPRSLSTAR